MNDYYAKESTICDSAPVCFEKELSASDILKETRKELTETISVLSVIRLSLEGKEPSERKTEEPQCLYDEIIAIEHMATDCMGLSHAILDKLLGIKL